MVFNCFSNPEGYSMSFNCTFGIRVSKVVHEYVHFGEQEAVPSDRGAALTGSGVRGDPHDIRAIDGAKCFVEHAMHSG